MPRHPSARRLVPDDQLAALRKVQEAQTTALADRAVAVAALAACEERRAQTLAVLDQDIETARQALQDANARLVRLMPVEDVATVTGQAVGELRRARSRNVADQ